MFLKYFSKLSLLKYHFLHLKSVAVAKNCLFCFIFHTSPPYIVVLGLYFYIFSSLHLPYINFHKENSSISLIFCIYSFCIQFRLPYYHLYQVCRPNICILPQPLFVLLLVVDWLQYCCLLVFSIHLIKYLFGEIFNKLCRQKNMYLRWNGRSVE